MPSMQLVYIHSYLLSYTPYQQVERPQEILTIANQVLGKNQLSLAKYLFIAAAEDNSQLDIHDVEGFFTHILERIDLTRDLHFQTNTTIDTLDYTGDGLNAGSKVVIAAAGAKKRELAKEIPASLDLPRPFNKAKLALPGILVVEGADFTTYANEEKVLEDWTSAAKDANFEGIQLIVLVNNADFASANENNFVWETFTKSNPAYDIYGIKSFTQFKHWGCQGPVIIDARRKPHHAPDLIKDETVERNIERLGVKGASLHGII
jgi:4-hydroxy-3-polyprenylbenzoate decarboxylase